MTIWKKRAVKDAGQIAEMQGTSILGRKWFKPRIRSLHGSNGWSTPPKSFWKISVPKKKKRGLVRKRKERIKKQTQAYIRYFLWVERSFQITLFIFESYTVILHSSSAPLRKQRTTSIARLISFIIEKSLLYFHWLSDFANQNDHPCPWRPWQNSRPSLWATEQR